MRNLVQALTELSSLDISGTNLAGTGSFDNSDISGNAFDKEDFENESAVEDETGVRCDIPGLISRVDKPLDFLGLYKTEHDASLRAHIPAKEISGIIFDRELCSKFLKEALLVLLVLLLFLFMSKRRYKCNKKHYKSNKKCYKSNKKRYRSNKQDQMNLDL